jgi:hypothetical protein
MKQANLEVGATRPQLEFHNAKEMFRAFVSGVGAGKTWAGAVEVLRQPASTTGVVAAPTFRMLEDATIRTFYEVAGKFVIPESRRQYSCRLVNDTDVLFRSADNPEHMRGPNLGWFWLDEAALMEPLIWDIMIGRLRRKPGRAWITTTPKGETNWVYDVFVRKADEDTFLIKGVDTSTNIFLPSSFMKSLDKRYQGAWKKQEKGGEFVNFGEHQAYMNYRPSLNLHKTAPVDPAVYDNLPDGATRAHADSLLVNFYDPRKALYICCDFNVAIQSWPVLQIHPGIKDKSKMQPMVLTELTTIGRADVRKQCDLIKTRFPGHAGPMIFYGDASGNNTSNLISTTHYDLIQEHLFAHYDVQIMVPKRNPKPMNRILTVNDALRGTGVWHPLLIDEEECPILIRDLESCVMNEQGDDVLKVKDPNDERYYMTHSSDALGYFLSLEVPVASTVLETELENAKESLANRRVERDSRPHNAGLMGV